MPISKNRVPMPEQAPSDRIHNWDEVAIGYTDENAMQEAQRCLNCKNHPCTEGCPVSVHIPQFIKLITEGDFDGAYREITDTNSLPAVCGRVCPQEVQCEGRCVRAKSGESVAIGRLERYVADRYAAQHGSEPSKSCAGCTGCEAASKQKVAVIGSGPAGLSCAGDLAKYGYDVTIFEALHAEGGVLVYGIPQFRLPKEIVAREIASLKEKGVKIETNMVIGRSLTIDELLAQGFSAIFVSTGAGLPSFMGIEGENSNGVYSANEFLTRVNLMKAYRDDYDTPIRPMHTVAVVGGGNVAMDSARCAMRLGAEKVYIVYRRGKDEIPARAEELHHAIEEGVCLQLLTAPLKVNADEKGNVVSMICVEMELGEPDATGRRKPVQKEGSEFELECDTIINAIGTTPNPLIRLTTPGLDTNKKGCIVVHEDGVTTSRERVFAGGDAVTGSATVILAMGAGKEGAAAIHRMLSEEK